MLAADVKHRWVEALRSGLYAKGMRRFKSDTGYCCLGVLCEVLGHPELIAGLDDDTTVDDYCTLRRISGLDVTSTECLWSLNDLVYPETFGEIAEWIDAHL